MKKRIYIIIFMLLTSLIIIYYLPKNKKVNIKYEYEDYICVYYEYNEDIKPIYLPALNKDIIYDIYEYLSIRKNSAPLGYESYISNNSYIKYYNLIDNHLKLYLNDASSLELSKSIDILYNSYKNIGIKSVSIYQNDILVVSK